MSNFLPWHPVAFDVVRDCSKWTITAESCSSAGCESGALLPQFGDQSRQITIRHFINSHCPTIPPFDSHQRQTSQTDSDGDRRWR